MIHDRTLPAPPTSTDAPPRPRTRRRSVTVLAIAIVVAIGGTACSSLEAASLTILMNRSREAAGVAPVLSHPQLVDKAQAWASVLASEGTLRHSSLWSGVPGGCTAVAENVAAAGTTDQIHQLWMNSAPHRANLLSSTYNFSGTGVVRGSNGLFYAVTVFARG
jgi:uncharacterized protein YkwD